MKKIVSLLLCVVFIIALVSCGIDSGVSEDHGSKDVEKSADTSEPEESSVTAESSEPADGESSEPEESDVSEPETSKDITEYGWYYEEYHWYYDGIIKPEDYLCFYYKNKLQRFDFLTGHQSYGKELVSYDEIKNYYATCGLEELTPEYNKCCHYYRIIKKYNVDKEEFKQNIEAWRAINNYEILMEIEYISCFTDEEIDVLFGDDEEAVKQMFKRPCVLYYNGELYHFHELMFQTDESTLKMLWDAGVLEPFADDVLEKIDLNITLDYAKEKYKEIKEKLSD